MFQNLIFCQKENLEFIETLLVTNIFTHHDVLSISVAKELHTLPVIFEKYPKMLLYYFNAK